ncbi:Fc receptor-like A, partial [Huso huso]
STELPQPTITLEPPFPEIFTGETVTLRCGVKGGSAGWKYLWYKDSEDTPVLQTAGRSITGDSYTITAAAVSDQGQYCCRGQRGDQPLYSQLSDKVILTVSGLPQTTLTLEPPFPDLFTGEAVTLRCGVKGGSAGWKYLWYKDSEDTPVLQTAGRSITGDSYTITAAAVSDQGQYCCRGQRGDQPLYSQLSDKGPLNVLTMKIMSYSHSSVSVSTEMHQTTLTLEPPSPEIFTGETVTLRCGVEGGSAGWKYLWYKDSEDTPVLQTADRSITGDSYTITAAAVSDQGQYWCRGQKGGQPLYSQHSDPVILNITGEFLTFPTIPIQALLI